MQGRRFIKNKYIGHSYFNRGDAVTVNDALMFELNRVTKLPTLPVIAREILALDDDDLISFNKLANIIENDPAIAAKIMSYANSAFLGCREPSRTLHSAIIRIGFDSVKNIALAISLMTVLEGERHQEALSYRRVFNHSVATGIVAKLLAGEFKLPVSDEIIIAAMLHDLGLLVLSRYFPDRYPEVLHAFQEDKTLPDAEKEVFNFTHADVGGWVAGKWNLPETVYDAVLCHHTPLTSERNMKLVAVVHIADYIASRHIIRSTVQDFCPALETSCLATLGITEDNLSNVIREIKSGEFFAGMFIS